MPKEIKEGSLEVPDWVYEAIDKKLENDEDRKDQVMKNPFSAFRITWEVIMERLLSGSEIK